MQTGLRKKTDDIFAIRQHRERVQKMSGWCHLHGLLLVSQLMCKGWLEKDLTVDRGKM